jgi:hypothetical protein
MTTIRASCTICGDVELTVHEVEVRVCDTTDAGEYCFDCPRCAYAVRRSADPHIIDLLVASGVRLVNWSLPLELFEEHSGAPISHDDLLEFHLRLGDDEAMASAIESLRQRPEPL